MGTLVARYAELLLFIFSRPYLNNDQAIGMVVILRLSVSLFN